MQVTITAIEKAGGGIQVTWDDGCTQYYGSLDDIREKIATAVEPDQVKLMLLGWWLARSADGSNTNVVVGKTLTFDLSVPSPFKVQ